MDLTLRSLTPADRDAAVRLLTAQLDEHDIPSTPDSIGRMLDGLLEHPALGSVLIARLEAQPVGLAYLAFIWTLEHGGRVVWLEELYVTPAHRGQGIGQRLLRAALDHARERGCVAIDLEVESSHARAANLYAREGFQRLERTRWTRRLDGAG